MTKKEQTSLLPSAQHHSVHFGLAPVLSSAMIETRDGEYMLEEAGKRALRVAVGMDLSRFVISQTGLIKSHASRVFDRECAVLDHIAASAQTSASSEYIAQFHHLLKDHLADQLLEIDAEAARQMRHELAIPLPTEKPKSQRSTVARFFLGDE
ncbi:MAG: hypothetical protein IT328_23350 [Caldilineaceae bacterium]|nr:hypothetical protein [Caldilineaceae bacterium]